MANENGAVAIDMTEVDITDGASEQQQKQQNEKLKNQAIEVISREKDINKLTEGVVELHQAFDDLALAVDQQQDILNLTEANIEQTKDIQNKAGDELVKAEKYQRSWKRKRTIIIIVSILLIIIGIIILIVILR